MKTLLKNCTIIREKSFKKADFLVLDCFFIFEELGPQQLQAAFLVLQLGLLRLTVYNDTGRIVCQPNRGVRGIDALAAVAGGAHDVDPDILVGNVDDDVVVHLGDHGHRDRRGVDPAA